MSIQYAYDKASRTLRTLLPKTDDDWARWRVAAEKQLQAISAPPPRLDQIAQMIEYARQQQAKVLALQSQQSWIERHFGAQVTPIFDKPLESAIGAAAAGTSAQKPKAAPQPARKSDEGLRRAIKRAQSLFNPISLLS